MRCTQLIKSYKRVNFVEILFTVFTKTKIIYLDLSDNARLCDSDIENFVKQYQNFKEKNETFERSVESLSVQNCTALSESSATLL
jgi:hypothetical protein